MFSNNERTGRRVPLNTHAPLTRPGTRSTDLHVDQSSMAGGYARIAVAESPCRTDCFHVPRDEAGRGNGVHFLPLSRGFGSASLRGMNLTLPDVPITRQMGDAQLRLELACALYAQGKVTKVSGAELAGVDFFSFQKALGERRISTYTVEDLHGELEAMDRMFAKGDAGPRQS
jgi:predicted HTH domain antitoxin